MSKRGEEEMRYHLLPFLIPRNGSVYELRNTLDAKILYFKDETSWVTLLSSLERPWYRRIFYQPWMSWEMVATKDQIHYYVWVPNEEVGKAFRGKFFAEHPDVDIVEVADRDICFSRPHAGTKLFTESHWSVPIKTYHNEVVDTQSELIEFLDGLNDGQEVHIQFLVQPAYRTARHFAGVQRQLSRELEVDPSIEKDNELYMSAIEGKQTRMLSRMGMKVVAFGRSAKEAKRLIARAKGSIGTFSSGRLNVLRGREWWWFRTIRPLFRYEFKHRIYPFWERNKKRVHLGTEEMAAIMRLPSERIQNNKLNRLKMRSTPLPAEMKNHTFDSTLSIPLGEHLYHGQKNEVRFDLATLRYHAAFIGMSGMGKSTAMYNLVEDLLKLDGAGSQIGGTVIDPHGDLCQDIAARVPPEKQHLVRYIKFSEGEFPFNVYDVDFATTEDQIAQTVADVLKRTWKDFWGPNIDDNFLNGGIALQRVGEASLHNLQRLLSDQEYRQGVLDRLNRNDPVENDLFLYFHHLHSLHDRELQQKTNSTLNKLRKITLSRVMGRMLRAKTNGLQIRKSMDEGNITLLDLSELTTDEKKLIGSMCLTYAELAGKSRADTLAAERDKLPYHFVMVDEAPTLMDHSKDAIESFASELRKYKVSILLGMQGLKGQVPSEVSDAIFRNFGTFVSFRLGNPDDAEVVSKALYSETLTENDFLSVEPYHGYIRMQVGNERTRPYLIRMKSPTKAKFAHTISDMKKRTVEEAMEKERLILKAKEEKERPIYTEEKSQHIFSDNEGIQGEEKREPLSDELDKGSEDVSDSTNDYAEMGWKQEEKKVAQKDDLCVSSTEERASDVESFSSKSYLKKNENSKKGILTEDELFL
jgi:hypothetical protein